MIRNNQVCTELHVFKIKNENHIHQKVMQTLLQADKSELPVDLIVPLAALKFNPSTSPASSGLSFYIPSGARLFLPCHV